jgi:hypothetical protein
MRIFGLILFSILTIETFGQKWPFDYWHEGKMVLESGDTLKGKIKYDINSDIIQLDQNNHLQSFTARKLIYYEIWDATSSRYRQFYSIPYAPSGGYKTPIFFELLSEGKLTLLAREALEYKSSSVGYYGYSTVSRLVLVDKYFTLNDKGQVESFSGKKSDLLDLMSKRDDEVKHFIKSKKLDLDYKYDMAQVFRYYNSLFPQGK